MKQGQLTMWRLRFALLFSLLACLPIAAQSRNDAGRLPIAPQEMHLSQPDKAAGQRPLLKTTSPSPYLIESLIDINEEIDLKQIWQMLNLAPPTAEAYRCDGDCEAETFDIATGDEDHKKTVALRISYENRHFYQYLIFKQIAADSLQEGAWKLLGNINCFDQQEASPSHRIEQGDGRTWLVIKESRRHGAGMLAYGEAWYEIQESLLKPVLSYPVEGRDPACKRQLRRSYKAFVLRHDLDNGTYTIPIQFLIAYDIDTCGPRDSSLSLFAKGQKAYYVWNAEKGRFVLDEARSGVTEKQIASFADAQGFSDEAFVEDNFHELANIATNGDAQRKVWLRKFLTRLQNTQRKADLQRLLEQ
jgi:hypothetical protein